MAVLLNHLWPTRMPGGYVGVDVFFVISGFLITSHLTRELLSSGRISLARFYARRMRRLLPAALLVLAVTAAAAAALLPYPRWQRTGAEIIASATYVENWLLSALSVDYSALNDLASPVQHYWSLSVEEQFYLLWPLLLLGVWWLSRRSTADPRRSVAFALTALVAGSLIASVLATHSSPSQAYFVTYTRAWEFGVGGLIALLPAYRLPRTVAEILSLSGFAAIAVAAMAYDASTPFPGIAALLPVVGTAAVIVAGAGGIRLLHSSVSSSSSVQWLGAVSYSLYLWHWPIIVFTPFVLGSALSTGMKLGIVAVSLALADLTRRLVEVPAQRWDYLTGSSSRTFFVMSLVMLLITGAGGSLAVLGKLRVDADTPDVRIAIEACVGPQALEPGTSCPDPFGPTGTAVMGPVNAYYFTPPDCESIPDLLRFGDRTATVRCDFSGGANNPFRAWIVGDSHADQWKGPILDIARERGWVVTTTFGGGCPVIDAPFRGFREEAPQAEIDRCRSWSKAVEGEVARQAPDVVFTSSAGRVQLVDDGTGRSQHEQFIDGLIRTWSRWTATGITVVPLGGVPFNGEVRDPNCTLLSRDEPVVCAADEDEANPADPYLIAAQRMADPKVAAFDASPYMCEAGLCYSVIGGVSVYYDADHLNLDFVRRFAPMLELALDDAER